MKISVAPTEFSDWPQLVALLHEAFAYMEARIDPPSSLNRLTADDLRQRAQTEALILATEGAALIGCAFAAVRDDCVYIGKVAVAPAARRKGVARALFAAAETLAHQHGRHYLELQTRVELTENHATFAALGFATVAETAHPGYDRPTSITMRKRVANTPTTLGIAADHAGFALKQTVIGELEQRGLVVRDFGTTTAAACDYPDFAHVVGSAISRGEIERAILICGTGVGMSIAANRHAAVRAVVCSESLSARLARQHNDANVLCLGARIIGVETALDIVAAFLAAPFAGGKHAVRVEKLTPR